MHNNKRSPESLAKRREYSKRYRIVHRAEIREKGRIWAREHKEVRVAYYTANKATLLKNQKAYYEANKDNINARRKIFRAKNPLIERSWKLKTKYGISEKEFNFILKNQNGVCAICKKSEWKWRGPVVDHEHDSGKVRGILCHNCNLALGHINEDSKIAKSMSDYLERFMMAVLSEDKEK